MKLLRKFDEKRFEELAKVGFQTKSLLSRDEKGKLLEEIKRLYIPFTFFESLLYIFVGTSGTIFISGLLVIFIENPITSTVLRVLFYFLGISFFIFGIHQMIQRTKYTRSYKKRLEFLKKFLMS